MELRYAFDPERFYLGTVCRHGHRWPGTDRSLRRRYFSPSGVRVNHCIGCTCKKPDWLTAFIDYESMGFQPGRRLGKLCANGHTWEGMEMSLRDKRGKCIECEKARDRRGMYDPEYAKEWHRRRMENPELAAEHKRRCHERYLSLTPEQRQRRIDYKRERREALRQQGLTSKGTKPVNATGARPKEEIRAAKACRMEAAEQRRQAKAQERERRQNDPEWIEKQREKQRERARIAHLARYEIDPNYRLYHREKSKRRKAQERGSIGLKVKPKQIRARFEQFGHRCAYCGAEGDLQIEHLVPIARGGTHTLGNILPACQRCNFSKRDNDSERWYRRQPYFSEAKWRKILQVLGLAKGSPAQLTLL